MRSYRGYVYLIGSSRFGWYKIGRSRTAAIRVQALGVLLPFKIKVFSIWKTESPSKLESAMHERYSEYRLNGEWFSFNLTELRQIVESATPLHTVKVFESSVDTMCAFTNMKEDRVRRMPETLGGMHFGDWIKQYLVDNGLEATKKNTAIARREVLKLFQDQVVTDVS